MKVNQGIAALTAALVHPSAMNAGFEHARHQTFLFRTLVVVFAALAIAPFYIVFEGIPALSETLMFSLCLTPLGAVMLVSKTGQVVAGHMICVLCLLGAAIMLALTHEAGLGCALAWLIVAQTESVLSADRRLVTWTGIASGLVFVVLAGGDLAGLARPTSMGRHEDILTGLALAIATMNAFAIVDLRARSRQADNAIGSRTRTIIDTIDDLIVSYDSDGTVESLDRSCERHLNIAAQDLVGRGFFEHIHVADRPIFLKAIADAAHNIGTVAVSFRLRTLNAGSQHDGTQETTFLWMEMRARRLARPGLRDGVVGLLRNVTENRDAVNALETARQSADTASRSRDHFLANMSHELRTPLNAIIGFSEILGDNNLRPADLLKQIEYARIIHQSGQHLLAVVNSILDMSKLQSGTFSLFPETFEVGPLIESCCEIVTLNAQEGQIELVKAYGRAMDPVVGDRRACKQILINLLSNAIKFTPKNGRVTISAHPEGNSLMVCVADTGIGIGAADLAKLGDPFFQVKSALDRPYEGTGLGLSVVRGLVGLHGGTISVESEPDRGTSVIIRLPLDCRFVTPGAPSAKIETIARRRGTERFALPPHDLMVKKSA